jgi:hypothetical protein
VGLSGKELPDQSAHLLWLFQMDLMLTVELGDGAEVTEYGPVGVDCIRADSAEVVGDNKQRWDIRRWCRMRPRTLLPSFDPS